MTNIGMILGLYDSNPALFALLYRLHGYHIVGDIDYHALQIKKSGYGEPQPVVNLNEQLLTKNDARWYDVYTPRQIDTWHVDVDHHHQLTTYLDSLPDNAFINDPRMCYTLPLWRQVLNQHNHRVFIIIPYQHPQIYAQHMHFHHHMSTRLALALWVAYTLASINYARHYPHMFVNHEELWTNWQSACQPLINHLAPDGLSPAVIVQVDAYVAMQQRKQLNKQPVSVSIKNMGVYQIACDVYDALYQSTLHEKLIDELHMRFTDELQHPDYRYDVEQFHALYHDTYLDKDARLDSMHIQLQAVYAQHGKQIDQISTKFAETLAQHEQQLGHMRDTYEHEITHLNEKISAMQHEIVWRTDINNQQQKLLSQLGWALRLLAIKQRIQQLFSKSPQ